MLKYIGIFLLVIQGGILDLIEWQFNKFKPVFFKHNFPDIIGPNCIPNTFNAFLSGIKAGIVPTLFGLLIYYFLKCNFKILGNISIIGLLIGILSICYYGFSNKEYNDIYLLHKIFYMIGLFQFIFSIFLSYLI